MKSAIRRDQKSQKEEEEEEGDRSVTSGRGTRLTNAHLVQGTFHKRLDTRAGVGRTSSSLILLEERGKVAETKGGRES